MTTRFRTRRELLADVGRGMVVAGLGAGAAADLGIAPAWAADEAGSLSFGELDGLVGFIQDTPPDKLVGRAVEKLANGTDLKQLVAAAALANARAFGGEDYVGFHTLMALSPAYHMAAEEADPARKPMAALKVLVRNATRLQEKGGRAAEVLRPVPDSPKDYPPPTGERLQQAVRDRDLNRAEQVFARSAGQGPEAALNHLMHAVDDGADVHRIVLVSRSWDLFPLVGRERAHTLLRQSVHYCVKGEEHSAKYEAGLRDLLPKLLDRHRLLGKAPSARTADDRWVEALAATIFNGTPEAAAEAAAAALAEGFSAEDVGEAVALAANQLVLRDEGRPQQWASANKPVGSVHGDSPGVHACDAVNAWRAVARAGDPRTRLTSVVLAAYHVARDRAVRPEFTTWQPYPRPAHLGAVRAVPADKLLAALGEAVRAKDQGRAAAIAARLGDEKAAPADVFGLLRGFAVSEDGALHAEKFYRTSREDFDAARPALKWRRLVGLAKVTASTYGYPAPGYDEARRLLKAT